MSSLSTTIASGFVHQYTDFGLRVHRLAEDLSEEQFWTKPYSYGNSFGNLVLHITGNLNYYIGAQIAQTGYIRQRDLEFTQTHPGEKKEVLKKLDEVVDIVIASLKSQTDSDWEQPFSAVGVDDVKDRFGIYLLCAVHFHHHIGQMIYLVKELTHAS
jgi:uncharacterized damage-inducible protein DinB